MSVPDIRWREPNGPPLAFSSQEPSQLRRNILSQLHGVNGDSDGDIHGVEGGGAEMTQLHQVVKLPHGPSGIGLADSADGPVVSSVYRNNPLLSGQLHPGDRIVSISVDDCVPEDCTGMGHEILAEKLGAARLKKRTLICVPGEQRLTNSASDPPQFSSQEPSQLYHGTDSDENVYDSAGNVYGLEGGGPSSAFKTVTPAPKFTPEFTMLVHLPQGPLGIGLTDSADGPVVSSVYRDNPLLAGQLRPGDRIVSLRCDGALEDCKGMSCGALADKLGAARLKDRTLVYVRASEPPEVRNRLSVRCSYASLSRHGTAPSHALQQM